jgi:hypothetical protein
MLLLSEEGEEHWRERRLTTENHSGSNWVSGIWQPWSDVRICTLLVDLNPWHLRIHRIESNRTLKTAEGAFAVKRYHEFDEALPLSNTASERYEALAAFPWGASRIVALEPESERTGTLVIPAPNLNILEPSCVIPTLMGTSAKGISILASAIRAGDRDAVINAPLPVVTLREDGVEIVEGGGSWVIRMGEDL